MDLKRLQLSDFAGFFGAGVLLLSLFLPWFSTSCDTYDPEAGKQEPSGCNEYSALNGDYRDPAAHGDFSAWEIYNIPDWLLVAACAAPFILAWIIIRGHQLTWRPGEVTMIVGIVAFGLILCNGIILGRPGDTVDVSLAIGYFVGLLGAALITGAGVIRQSQGRTPKPPGV